MRTPSYQGARGAVIDRAVAGSARGPQGCLSKDMLATLDSYNKLQAKGHRKGDPVADRIVSAAKHGLPRGELKPANRRRPHPPREVLDEVDGIND